MSEKVYTIDEIKAIVEPIAKKYGVERVYLFGSYSRGEQDKNSDLDFHIDGGKIRSLIGLGGFWEDLKEAFEKDIDVVTTGGLKEKFYNAIKGDEILLYEG